MWLRVGASDEMEMEARDDGPGVADADVDRIFQWFQTTRPDGQGIGLPSSRRMAEAMGGSLDMVRAKPATFRLSVPRGAA